MSKPPSRIRLRPVPVVRVHDYGRWTSGGERDIVGWAASFARAPGLFDGNGLGTFGSSQDRACLTPNCADQ